MLRFARNYLVEVENFLKLFSAWTRSASAIAIGPMRKLRGSNFQQHRHTKCATIVMELVFHFPISTSPVSATKRAASTWCSSAHRLTVICPIWISNLSSVYVEWCFLGYPRFSRYFNNQEKNRLNHKVSYSYVMSCGKWIYYDTDITHTTV